MKRSPIQIFFTDIDGVWTDGGMIYGSDGVELKRFNTADSAGVLLLHLMNIPTVIITGEKTRMVSERAEKLKIHHVYQGVRNKVECAEKVLSELGLSFEEAAFIGDDLNDLQLLGKVALSACPDNAPEYVKSNVDWCLPVRGGDGAFRSFVERYLSESGQIKTALERAMRFFSERESES